MPLSPATVVVSTRGVAGSPELGGFFWVYMQYIQGLREQGCDVFWFDRSKQAADAASSAFFDILAQYGLDGRGVIAPCGRRDERDHGLYEYVGMSTRAVLEVFRRADLLLNFDHGAPIAFLSQFRRTAFVDLDPGLCQIWIETGGLHLAPHNLYFTIGETVGTPSAAFPDNGKAWIRIHPAVCLTLWPFTHDSAVETFTTVSSWWEGWLVDGKESYDNSKRASFLRFVDLPQFTPQPLEVALSMTPGDPSDAADRVLLERHGWRVCRSFEVAGSPERYRSYIQQSRGEFSCAKPSYVALQTAWVSDRTICYLSSGKPAVVQYTGASTYLPSGQGLFRFTTLAEAVEAFAIIGSDYKRHCRAAREIAEAYFSARDVCRTILNQALP